MRIPNLEASVASTEASSLSPSNSGLPELAILFAEVGYIRLRWERVGVRRYGLSLGRNPSPGSPRRSDPSLWERWTNPRTQISCSWACSARRHQRPQFIGAACGDQLTQL